MSSIKSAAIVGGACVSVLAVAAAAFVLGDGSSAPAASDGSAASLSAGEASSDPIVIDTALMETFTPATSSEIDANADKVISPRDAFQVYAHTDTWSLPDDATITEGYLTLPLGAHTPGEYTAKHQLVYAYKWHQCGPTAIPVPAPDAKTTPTQVETPAPLCTSWTFLDATTGELIDGTWSE